MVVSDAKKKRVPFVFVAIPKTFLGWLPHLASPEVRVYMALAAHSLAYNKFDCRVPMTVLQEYSGGLSRATIGRAVRSLETRGLLKVSRGIKRVSAYRILTPPYVAPMQHRDDGLRASHVQHEQAV